LRSFSCGFLTPGGVEAQLAGKKWRIVGEATRQHTGAVIVVQSPMFDGYAEDILKDARVGDLPIERPVRFQLVVDLKTARALGRTTSESVLVRADEIISEQD